MLRVLLGCFALCVVCSRSKPTEKKSRVLRPPQHEGDTNYDHEAFLGPDEAKTFEQLAPEESRRRLGSVLHLHHNIIKYKIKRVLTESPDGFNVHHTNRHNSDVNHLTFLTLVIKLSFANISVSLQHHRGQNRLQ